MPAFTLGAASDRCPECQQIERNATPETGLPASTPQPGVQSRPDFRSVVTILIALNVAIFVLMVVRGVSPTEPTSGQLLTWGANYGPLSLGSQPWRVLTSVFLHIGIVHLLVNMWSLWVLGKPAERLLGAWTFLALYLLSGIAGSIASLWWDPLRFSAGASGAIFGVLGGLIAVMYLGKLPLPKQVLNRNLKNLLVVAGINLIYGLRSQIDNSAHLGGLVAGLAFGALVALTMAQSPEERGRLRLYAAALMALILGGATSYVKFANAYLVEWQRGPAALDKGDLDQAIRSLKTVTAKKPDYFPAQALLGVAYLRKKQYPEAEAALTRALKSDPSSRYVHYNLGVLYLQTQRYAQAQQVFTVLLRDDSKDKSVLILLGAALDAQGQHDDAIQTLQRALESDPNDRVANFYLAQAYRGKGMLKEAQEAARKAGPQEDESSQP